MEYMNDTQLKEYRDKMTKMHEADWVTDEDGNVECYDCTNPVSMDEVYGNPMTVPRCEECYYDNK